MQNWFVLSAKLISAGKTRSLQRPVQRLLLLLQYLGWD